jgi:hypothetical protein
MSEFTRVLERAGERFPEPKLPLEHVLRHRDRKRRNQRIGAASVAVAVSLLVIGGALTAAERRMQPASPGWPARFTTWGHDGAAPVAVGLDGVYVAGNTYDPDDPTSSDAFVSKYDAGGHLIWTRTDDLGRYDSALALAMDGSDVLAAGVSGDQAFVRRYADDGTLQWSWSAPTGRNGGPLAGALGIAPTGDGGAFVSGDGKRGVFVLRLDAAGHEIWSSEWGRGTYFGRLAVAGNAVYVAAEGSQIDGRTDSNVNLRRYSSSGRLIWQRTYATRRADAPTSIAADASGVYVAGFRGARKHSDGVTFLRKYSTTGAVVWTEGDVPIASIAADGSFVYEIGFVGQTTPGTISVQVRDAAGSLVSATTVTSDAGASDESALGVGAGALGVFVTGEWGPHTFPGYVSNPPTQRWPGWDAFLSIVGEEHL